MGTNKNNMCVPLPVSMMCTRVSVDILFCFQSAFTEEERASRADADKHDKSSKTSRQEVGVYDGL